jgi:hypothetical protein
MSKRNSGNTIEKNPRGCDGKQRVNPIPEMMWETPSLEEVKDVLPTNRVECFSSVKLEKEDRYLFFVSCEILDIEKVVMYAPPLYQCTLGIGNKVVHERAEADGKHLGDDFCNSVDEANRPIIRNLLLWPAGLP